MSDIKIKLCGISNPKDTDVLNELMPDYVGFVFAQKSSRRVDIHTAKTIKDNLNPQIKTVGVFKNQSLDEIQEVVESGVIDAIQLHGDENNRFIQEIKYKFNKMTIKAFGIVGEKNIMESDSCEADMILLDAPGGGTGTTFDHSLLRKIKRPFFLAGGLSIHNIGELIDKYSPYGVDVSSGIETQGQKDHYKMKEFVRAVR